MKYLHLWQSQSSGIITTDGYCNSEFESQADALEILEDALRDQRYYKYFATIAFLDNGRNIMEDWSGLLEEWKIYGSLEMAYIQDIKSYYLSTR